METHALHYYLSFLHLMYHILPSYGIESPLYIVVLSAPDVEIRLYNESIWISALVQASNSFEESTEDGFHRFRFILICSQNSNEIDLANCITGFRLYQYIHGANANSSRLKKTAPILTSISQAAVNSSNHYVKFYLSRQVGAAAQPNPELNLQVEKWRSHCIAVRKFSGFAKDANIDKEKLGLVSSLDKLSSSAKSKNTVVLEDKSTYAVAQYNASFHLSGRINEVWMNVSAEGCPLY